MDPADPETQAEAPRADWTRRTFASLSRPNFRLFFVGQGISLLGTWMAMAAEQWLVLVLTGSNAMLGVVAAAGMVPLVFSPIGGGIADRVPKRRVLVAATLLNFLVALTTAAIVYFGVVQVWMVVILAVLGGVVLAVEMPVRQAFLVEMVGKETLLNAIALNTALFNVTRMLGQGFAGVIMHAMGMSLCFFVDAISFLAVVACLLAMRLPPSPGRASEWKGFGHFFRFLREGFGHVRRDPRILSLVALLAVSMLFGLPYASQMSAFARDVLGQKELGYGMLLFVNGLGATVGALWLAGQGAAFDRRKVAFRMQALFGVALVGLALAPNVQVALSMMVLAGFGMVTFFSASNAFIQSEAPDELRGRVLGVWHCVFGAALPAGQLLMGFAAGAIGVRASFAIGGAVCVVLALLLAAGRRGPRTP